MTTAITLALIAGALAALAVPLVLDRRMMHRRQVAVHLRSGETVVGMLYQRRPRHVWLKSCMVTAEGKTSPADGDVIIDRANVTFLQILGNS